VILVAALPELIAAIEKAVASKILFVGISVAPVCESLKAQAPLAKHQGSPVLAPMSCHINAGAADKVPKALKCGGVFSLVRLLR
jgi:hypothetical protein